VAWHYPVQINEGLKGVEAKVLSEANSFADALKPME
jgi:hypothetical protein